MKIILLFLFILFTQICIAQSLKDEYNECAIEYALKKDFPSAIEYFTRVIAIDSLDSIAYFDRGMIKEFMGDIQGALEDFNQQIKIDDSNVDSYFLRGIIHDKLSNNSEAIKDYKKVIELENSNADAHFYLGKIYVELKKYKLAINEFNSAIKFNPLNSDYILERANLHKLKDDKKNACQDYHLFLELVPNGGDKIFGTYCN